MVQLQPVADATVDSSQPGANFGADPELDFGKVYSSGPPSMNWFLRGHVQFDLTPVVGLGVPQRVRLFWYQSHSSAAGCLAVNLHRITAPWAENTVTWNNKPSHDPSVAASACVGDSFSLGWKQFDVTALAQGWLAGTFANLGMVIRDPSETTAGASRPGYGHSRESTAVMLRPYLELDYGSTFGSGCGAGSVPVQLFGGGAPHLGSSFVLQTYNLPFGSLPGVIAGGSNTQWGAVPLPAPLDPAGFVGCSLLVSAEVLATFSLLTQPTLDVTIAVPNDTGLVGLQVFTQTLAFGPTGSFFMSNGVGVTVY
ncbi:MAG TPA: DNRLRE domain-containing protein [Planctomycetota bacterium]|nr:DNRLRE domain-containing protein [Planctomycetota bacterium]